MSLTLTFSWIQCHSLWPSLEHTATHSDLVLNTLALTVPSDTLLLTLTLDTSSIISLSCRAFVLSGLDLLTLPFSLSVSDCLTVFLIDYLSDCLPVCLSVCPRLSRFAVSVGVPPGCRCCYSYRSSTLLNRLPSNLAPPCPPSLPPLSLPQRVRHTRDVTAVGKRDVTLACLVSLDTGGGRTNGRCQQ